MFERREVTVQGTRTIYRVYVPPDVAGPLPVILFLHGAGESGTDGLAQTTVGLGPALQRNPVAALCVFPQASRGYGWRGFNLAAAVAALDEVEREYDVDRERITVTGISMGGYGAWLLALQSPERFSAIVPVCGGLDGTARLTHEQAAARLAHLPHWVFHGEADNIIPVEESRVMVDALRAAGADVRYTEYPRVRHNSWDRAYAEPELFPWLTRATRKSAPQ